jgi:hypothetical protein
MARVERPAGLVVLGSGAIPLASARDRRDLVAAAGSEGRVALTNNRYSADVVAIARAWPTLDALPDLPSDNALPRWLGDAAGYDVSDLRGRWQLAVDVDVPFDLVLIGAGADAPMDISASHAAIARVKAVALDPAAELLVAGRTSATTLAWLERNTPSRTRALVEERGLRTSVAGQRPPASVLGALVERYGTPAFGTLLSWFGDAAVIDTRVLMADRLGRDEAMWPDSEDRYASDLLLTDAIADPWLRSLTASAVAAPIPILLGGHTLVGPGLRLALGARQRGASWT